MMSFSPAVSSKADEVLKGIGENNRSLSSMTARLWKEAWQVPLERPRKKICTNTSIERVGVSCRWRTNVDSLFFFFPFLVLVVFYRAPLSNLPPKKP
mmetsp:Transcript_36913/g.147353  ORF Transcript_36913/g.147353 Transcript_36913/m.147353 type:complete len:97 (-) Transcript_36913:671-961(-)